MPWSNTTGGLGQDAALGADNLHEGLRLHRTLQACLKVVGEICDSLKGVPDGRKGGRR